MALGYGDAPRRARGQDRGRGAARADAPLRAPRAGAARRGGRRPGDEPHHRRRPARATCRACCPRGSGCASSARWERPPIFDLIQRGGGVDEAEMRRTFNLRHRLRLRGGPRTTPRALATLLRGLGEAPIGRRHGRARRRRPPVRGARGVARMIVAGRPRLRQRDQPAGHPRRDRRRRARRARRGGRLQRGRRRRSTGRATRASRRVVIDHKAFADRAAFDARGRRGAARARRRASSSSRASCAS